MKKNVLMIGMLLLLATALTSCAQINTNLNAEEPGSNENVNVETNSNQNDEASNMNENSIVLNQSENIRNLSISANDTISSPLTLSGEAKGWFFEATFPMKIEDANGNELYTGPVIATDDWMQEGFVPFTTRVTFATPTTPTGRIILENDNPSGLPERRQQYTIPVQFSLGETTALKLYFQSSEGLPACGMVMSIERTVARTTAIGEKSLDELLRGPLLPEKEQKKVITAIPAGMTLQSLVIVGAKATVDLNSTTPLINDCQKATVKAQIEQTLKQFPTVGTVEVKVNGQVW